MRQKAKQALKASLMRVTVDEVLDEDLARLLVAPVRDDVSALALDDIHGFDEEQEIMVTRSNLSSLLNLKGNTLRSAVDSVGAEAIGGKTGEKRFWSGLREGQVFMVGKFDVDPAAEVEETKAEVEAPGSISRVGKAARQLLRIDRFDAVKSSGKRLYAQALMKRNGGDHGDDQE